MEVLQKKTESKQQEIDNFFSQYAARFNRALKGETPDIDGTVKSFAKCFIEASPFGINCGKNDEQFRTMIPEGYAFYNSIGITDMEIVSKETMMLDNYHTLTKVLWRSSFVKVDGSLGEIEFDVTYLLQKEKNEHKIFAYITGDEQKALRENELI